MDTPMFELKAKRFEILRDIPADGRIWHTMAEEPVRVATLISEAEFNKSHLLRHHRTVFLEDRIHD